ncbi:MAG: exodeoxyribonuclease VII large subunit [Candidatus Nomurabacteria bacterium]|jgi:exodeoxyribonuclease VII large subunit|nr:exodeoxyribonuclease VII large subunit [Candidatus Nomurabacteria bacterium]
MPEQTYTVSDFQAVCNQILDNAFAGVIIEGEVASFKINQGKFVFFDLKDESSSIGCFMMQFALRFPIEDGMRIRVKATPKITTWGKFSLTIQAIVPVGEGSLKKSFELLKKKLHTEGLFDPAKKRPLPTDLAKIGVISSTQAAGYADFCKILNERWGGLEVQVAHTQVQGISAADQIIRALKYFNEHSEVQIIAIIRGGGSADDLAVFNDEQLVRAIAASKVPIITGIGHEIDESLSDLAADLIASTPSNAAQMLTKDKRAEISNLYSELQRTARLLDDKLSAIIRDNRREIDATSRALITKVTTFEDSVKSYIQIVEQLNPEKVLERGYALISGKIAIGSIIQVITSSKQIQAEVKNVTTK